MDNYMTVGEVAKAMHTTVRTLQYYDREGLLKPSGKSEGGRRLYIDKDIVQLHQIQTMKYLGLSLDDIKNRLPHLDSPADVAAMLKQQAEGFREKIANLTESLHAIETLHEEVLQMESVDFKRYAAIIASLQLKNEYYWMIKHLDDETFDDLVTRFDKDTAKTLTESLSHIVETAMQYQKDGVQPESDKAQELAILFWNKTLEFAGGDVSMIPKLAELSDAIDEENDSWRNMQHVANTFFEPALAAYFTKHEINPFEQGERL